VVIKEIAIIIIKIVAVVSHGVLEKFIQPDFITRLNEVNI